MAELEKKYSDFQKGECKEEQVIEVVDEKLCPTCEVDPNFKLPKQWFEIPEAYLNKKFCEYHVRVYESEAKKEMENDTNSVFNVAIEDKIFEVAALKILRDLDKPINAGTKKQVVDACSITDTYYGTRSHLLGTAYLVSTPAFNFDQIAPNDDPNAEESDEKDMSSGGEFIIQANGLLKKLRILRLTLKTYEKYYSMAQHVDDSYVLRQEDDIVQRINYSSTARKLKNFTKDISDVLKAADYPPLGFPGLLYSKRPDRIKFVFKDSGNSFELKNIYVLPDVGCKEKYEKLKFPDTHRLRNLDNAVVYNFLQNLDALWNDLTAKETKPWLDWTLEYFYPTYIVDRGNIEDLGEARIGLECLLEDQLGLGNGRVVDSLAREVMSAFDSIEMKRNKNACRELDRLIQPEEEPKSKLASEERKDKMLARYEKEFKNKAYSKMVDFLNDWNQIFEDTSAENLRTEGGENKVTKENVFRKMKEYGLAFIEVSMPTYFFKNKNGKKQEANLGVSVNIYDKEDFERNAKNFATTKLNNLEEGSFGDQYQNSPHFYEAQEALKEVRQIDNKVIDQFKNTKNSELGLMDLIPIVGICGLSKMAGKALNCLVNGISFDVFLDMVIAKSFEFMKINTLDLFFNGLPADFKDRLNETIAKEFGPNVNISDLLGIKMADGGNAALKEILTINSHTKRVLSLFEKHKYPYTSVTNKEERDFLVGKLGKELEKWNDITRALDGFQLGIPQLYDRESKIYLDGEVFVVLNGEKRTFKSREKYAKAFVKEKIRKHTTSERSFAQQTLRIADSLVITSDEPEELNQFERSKNSLEETALGVKVDAVFDVVFDYVIDSIMEEFSADDLLARLRAYPAADFFLDQLEMAIDPKCPNSPIIYPPANDFLKSLSIDVCDPYIGLTLPSITIPSINWRFAIQSQFTEIVREALFKLVADIMSSLVSRLLNTLEGALCNAIEASVGFGAAAIAGGDTIGNAFLDALNEAFCNDGDDPATSRKKAEELADALFSPIMFDSGSNATGSGDKVSNIIGSVSSTKEILGALVAREGEEDDQFNTRVANAVTILAPEMRVLLGSPDQVAYFFSNLGSHLSPDDRERIRDLLDAGIPNLPTSAAICLTSEELDNWNDLRNQLLQDPYGDGSGRGGLTPEQAAERVKDLNDKTAKAVEDLLDDIGDLSSGDMIDKAVEKEMNKDACNPDNLLSSGRQDELTTTLNTQATDAFFSNVERSLAMGFSLQNGVIGEALADFDGNKEFARWFLKIFLPNYGNSQSERDIKRAGYGDGFIGRIMDAMTEEDEDTGAFKVKGPYPTTVAIKQREDILIDSNRVYDFGFKKQNVVFKFHDSTENDKWFGGDPQTYAKKVAARNNRDPKNIFDYALQVAEKINEQKWVNELSFVVPVSVDESKVEYMESVGFQHLSNEEQDIRKAFFNQFARRSIPLPLRDYSDVYEGAFESLHKLVVEMLMTDPNPDGDGIPNGYKFGYVEGVNTSAAMMYFNPDGITPYNLDEEEKTLGKFADDRVVPLDPSLYGGRYSNPPYYIEHRQFFGWMELATKAFDSPSGCDPKQPPLISFQDIKDRTKDLSTSLKNDPRLSEDPDCAKDIPFKALLDKKTQAHMDGIVRTTIRSYVAEYFMKGYGLFSNLEMSEENFDQSMFIYVAKKMKSEMYDLGWSFSSKRISITKEKYWYTFLEQCVEAYQRMMDEDGRVPSDEIMDALNEIQRGIGAYRSIGPQIKKKMRIRLGEQGNIITKPAANFDPLSVVRQGPVSMGLQAVAYRLTTDLDEKANFFNGGQFDDYSSFDMRFASIKKLKFFQKQYFIALYEEQATMIMSELIRDEYSRLIKIVTDGLKDKPRYSDLTKSLFSTLPGSTSKVGLSSFYMEKNTTSQADAGSVPEVKQNNATAPVTPTDKPQFIVESYARLIDRVDPNLPSFIRNRPQKYVGVIPLANLSQFVDQNINTLEDNYLSDFFGNLTFIYKGSFKALLDKGFVSDEWLARLNQLNGGTILSSLKDIRAKYIASRDFEDFDVKYDEAFLLEGENPEPVDTFGTTGVKYGLRLSIVFPEGFLTDMDVALIRSNPDFVNMSKNEKSYMFDDNSFVLPIVSEEIDVLDAKFLEFDPFSGTERYDLECLINKMTKTSDFKLFMDNIFNIKQASSLLSIYCMETFMASLGRKVAPEDSADSSGYERRDGKEASPEQDWDGTINTFAKNSLRRQFKSLYLSRTIDGTHWADWDDGGTPKLGNLFQMGNPFDIFALPAFRIPWWQRRMLKTKVYDANGQECADPKKDLT
jgi:hypothetical protein